MVAPDGTGRHHRRMSLEPGAVLATAVLGACVGGVVRTWTDAGSRLWTPADPPALRELMGRGLLARTMVGPERYREVGLLDADSGTLALVPRFPSSTDGDGVTLDGRVVSLGQPSPTAEGAADLVQYLDAARGHATESGEHLIVERGAAGSPSEPSVEVLDDATSVADVVATWGVDPWDVVLTFWRPPAPSA